MRIILIGYGVVGQSFTKLLLSKLVDLYNLYGMKPRIVACVDNKGSAIDTSGLDIQRLLEIKKNKGTVGEYHNNNNNKSKLEPLQIIENIDAEIVMELTPTNLKDGEPGLSHITSAMKYGKNVITVNKGPLSVAFSSLIELANFNGISFKFSGTVGGGTPILEFAKRCLKGDRIISFKGILNGTTNYILSKMEHGQTYDSAMNDAKEKGYAEANPSLDVDGFDAAAKLVIMANWVMEMKVTMKDIKRTGIVNVRLSDVKNAAERGNAVKLLAVCDSRRLHVTPTEVAKTDPICVNGTLNAVTFSSEHSGQQTIIGRGAGGVETASSVLRDLIEIKNTIYEI